MDTKSARFAMIILESEKSDDGQYIACIAKENENGYFLTNWLYGTDIQLARKTADKYNKDLGLSDKEVFEIVLSSMVLNDVQRQVIKRKRR